MIKMKLEEKVALISGAGSSGSGIGNGRAISILFAREGAKVGCADINLESAEETVEMIEDENGEAMAVQGDVTDSEDVEHIVEQLVSEYGGVDILVNVVGIGTGGGLLETSEEEWDKAVETNLKSIFLMSKEAVPHMTDDGGSIINISSAAGLQAHPMLSYATTKAGIFNMTRTMAVHLAEYGIRVNCIAPGFLDTPMVQPIMSEKRRKMVKRMVPLGRFGTAWDTAKGALYLASDDASFVTGITLVIDGGLHAGSKRPKSKNGDKVV